MKSKLALHMTDEEKYLLMQHFKSILSWKKTRHLCHRMEKRKLPFALVEEAIQHPQLVEYRFCYPSKRVLIQSRIAHNGRVVCAVLNLDTGRVLTAYWHRLAYSSRWRTSITYDEEFNICRDYDKVTL